MQLGYVSNPLLDEYADHLSAAHRTAGQIALVGRALLQQSLVVGEEMAEATTVGYSAGEIPMTFLVLRGMQQAVPDMKVIDVGGTRVEAETGADWEWWVEGRRQWFHMLIQAKVLVQSGSSSASYRLGSLVGRSGDRQVERLLAASRSAGVPALYALYNPLGAKSKYASSDCYAVSDDDCLPDQSVGITILAADAANRMSLAERSKRGQSVTDVPLSVVAPETAPWTCLVACWRACGMRLAPRSGGPFNLNASAEHWTALGFEGSYDPTDAAFLMASTALAIQTRGDDGASRYESALALTRSAVTDAPPPFVLDPNPENVQAAFAQQVLSDTPLEDRADVYTPSQVVILRRE